MFPFWLATRIFLKRIFQDTDALGAPANPLPEGEEDPKWLSCAKMGLQSTP